METEDELFERTRDHARLAEDAEHTWWELRLGYNEYFRGILQMFPDQKTVNYWMARNALKRESYYVRQARKHHRISKALFRRYDRRQKAKVNGITR